MSSLSSQLFKLSLAGLLALTLWSLAGVFSIYARSPIAISSMPTESIMVDTISVTNGAGVGTQHVAINNASGDANLVINEFDYDQPGTDTAEFIELKNIGTNIINLDDYTVELFNGANSMIYDSIDLPNINLVAGDYYVICGNSTTVANCDLDVMPDSDLIQNGVPDAIGLRLSGTLKDAVSYEGDSGSPYVEGSGAGLEDVFADTSADQNKGLSRYPDGMDSDQNNVDFSLRCITPGAANTSYDSQCTNPFIEFTLANYQVDEDGLAVGSSITLTRTGSISNASKVQISFSDNTATGNGLDYTSDPITITFPAGDAGSQTVTVPVTQDFSNEPAETLIMSLTAITNALLGIQGTATLTIVDDDSPAVLLNPTSGLTTTEASSTDTFQLVLQSQPTSPVTVTVVSTATSEGMASPAVITFTSLTWNEAQTVTVTGQDDAVDDGDQSYAIETIVQSNDNDYDSIGVTDVLVTNFDDDTSGFETNPSSLTIAEPSSSTSFTITLTSQPMATVTINLSSSDTDVCTVSRASVSLDAFNWQTGVTVTVTAVADGVADKAQLCNVVTSATSSDPNYNNLTMPDVSVTVNNQQSVYLPIISSPQ